MQREPTLVAGPLVLFGGECRRDKLDRLRASVTPSLQWTPLAGARNLIVRVRNRRVGGVVLLHGLIGHGDTASLIRALRAHHVPFDYAGRAGLASVIRALERLAVLATG